MRPTAIVDPDCPQPRHDNLAMTLRSFDRFSAASFAAVGLSAAGLLSAVVCVLIWPEAVLAAAAVTLSASLAFTFARDRADGLRWALGEDDVALTAPLAGMPTRRSTDRQIWSALRVLDASPDVDGSTVAAALDVDDWESDLARLNLTAHSDARERAQAILAGRA